MENGVASMMREVYRLEGRTEIPPLPVDEEEARVPFDEVLEGARVLSETRKDSPEELLSLLQTLYPNEPTSVIRAALASFIPLKEENPMPALLAPAENSYIRTYGHEKFNQKTAAGLRLWNDLTPDQVLEIRTWMNEGKKKAFPCKEVFDQIFGNPHGFIALILLTCEAGTLSCSDVDSAYGRFVGKKLNTVAVKAVAESLGIPLRDARPGPKKAEENKVIDFPEPSIPAPAPTPAPNREVEPPVQMIGGLRDEEILTMLLKISDQLDALTSKISGINLEGVETRLDALTARMEAMNSTIPLPATGSPTDIFGALSKLGLEVTLRPLQK